MDHDDQDNDDSLDIIYSIVIECSNLLESFPVSTGQATLGATDNVTNLAPTYHHDGPPDEDINEKKKKTVSRLTHSFQLWINYTGALGAVGISLDDRLRGHPDIREMVVDLLRMLMRNLEYGSCDICQPENRATANIFAVRGSGDPKGLDCDRSLETEAWTAAEQAIEELHFIAVAIRRASAKSQKYNLSSRFERDDDMYFEEFATLLVRREFPFARRSLCGQLGASIAVRRKRLFRQMLHEEKLSRRRGDDALLMTSELTPSSAVNRLSHTQQRVPGPITRILQRRIHHNNPAASHDSTSHLASEAARKLLRRKPTSLSAISRGSSVQGVAATIEYPPKPKADKEQARLACPFCAQPLDEGKLNNTKMRYWE